jgi:PAS domain S-box-containing protein
MSSIRGSQNPEPPDEVGTESRFSRQTSLGNTFPIESQKPGWIENTLETIERLLPRALKPKQGFFLSFKNRILIGTLVVIIGVVIIIGITLQLMVFPMLRGDTTAIVHLKVIHFLASLVIIAFSWLFIRRFSKKITLPLLELTKRADQISRDAGERISAGSLGLDNGEPEVSHENYEFVPADEIFQLTSSFNRMLVHLKASEARLRVSEVKYRFLFDNGPSPIFVIDGDDLRILDINARAEESYQYSRDELLSMSFADLGLDRDREQTRNHLKQLFPTEVTILPILKHRRKNGSLFMVSFQASLIRYGDRPAIIAAVWDVTERLEKQTRLIQAGKMAMLGEMATGIAHELNQPLNVIRLGCDYLTKKTRQGMGIPPDDLAKVTSELTGSVERASRIINHLRQFGRKADETMNPTDINKAIAGVFTLVGSQLENKGVRWELDLDESLPSIMGDSNRLEQVFINLILNARDAMLGTGKPPGSGVDGVEKVIGIKTFPDKDRVTVTVSDTGPGIPEDFQSKVFEPFFTTKKTGEGTGLGLSISYGIIKEHNGTIEIDSRCRQGTTFRLSFPALVQTENRNDQNPRG